ALVKYHHMREHPAVIRYTQELILFVKILIYGQSAGNQILSWRLAPVCFSIHAASWQNNKVGSSETIRGMQNIKNDFKFWLIGFTEGDGCFHVNKRGYCEFSLTQSSSDAQVLFTIKKELGFGSVKKQCKKSKTHYYRVRDREGILKIIKIFNGNLLTDKKRKQFELWLNAFNFKFNSNITLISSTNSPTLNNSWISGFTDAEGCFTASLVGRVKYSQVFVRYILSQKGEKELMDSIALLFGGRISYQASYEGYNMTVNLRKLNKVINYFSTYPLKTKKRISYNNWCKVHQLVSNKEHFTLEGILKIKNLISKINK
ncbi:hypothetical protein M569_07451, partial [Genlisea aurea]